MIIKKLTDGEYTIINLDSVASIHTDHFRLEFSMKNSHKFLNIDYNSREELDIDIALIIVGIEDNIPFLNLDCNKE